MRNLVILLVVLGVVFFFTSCKKETDSDETNVIKDSTFVESGVTMHIMKNPDEDWKLDYAEAYGVRVRPNSDQNYADGYMPQNKDELLMIWVGTPNHESYGDGTWLFIGIGGQQVLVYETKRCYRGKDIAIQQVMKFMLKNKVSIELILQIVDKSQRLKEMGVLIPWRNPPISRE